MASIKILIIKSPLLFGMTLIMMTSCSLKPKGQTRRVSLTFSGSDGQHLNSTSEGNKASKDFSFLTNQLASTTSSQTPVFDCYLANVIGIEIEPLFPVASSELAKVETWRSAAFEGKPCTYPGVLSSPQTGPGLLKFDLELEPSLEQRHVQIIGVTDPENSICGQTAFDKRSFVSNSSRYASFFELGHKTFSLENFDQTLTVANTFNGLNVLQKSRKEINGGYCKADFTASDVIPAELTLSHYNGALEEGQCLTFKIEIANWKAPAEPSFSQTLHLVAPGDGTTLGNLTWMADSNCSGAVNSNLISSREQSTIQTLRIIPTNCVSSTGLSSCSVLAYAKINSIGSLKKTVISLRGSDTFSETNNTVYSQSPGPLILPLGP